MANRPWSSVTTSCRRTTRAMATYHYPNMYAGGDEREALGFLWFHDHCLDYTSQNVYRGLVGTYLLFDERDSGNEEDLNSKAIRLPSGKYDVPLVIENKVYDGN